MLTKIGELEKKQKQREPGLYPNVQPFYVWIEKKGNELLLTP